MSDYAHQPQDGWLERKFRFSERGTTLPRDTMAGVTTFIVMSYIIFVNPQILSFAGIEGLRSRVSPSTVLAVTCLVAGVMTIAMGLYTNRALRDRPGSRLNATVAFASWPERASRSRQRWDSWSSRGSRSQPSSSRAFARG